MKFKKAMTLFMAAAMSINLPLVIHVSAEDYKDTINIAITAEPPTLDTPMTVSNISINIATNFLEPLFVMDENFQPQPMLAESYEVNPEMTEYTIKLRQDVLFHDGNPMKADDVVASMNYWLEKAERPKNLLGGTTFEKVDDYTVKAVLPKPNKDLIVIMASRQGFPAIRPKAAIEGAGEKGVTENIGTGPYKFKDWKHDQFVALEKFDQYKPREEKASGYAGKREALTPNIIYHIVPEVGTRLAGIMSGTYDIAEEIQSDNYATVSNDPNLTILSHNGGTLVASLNVTEGPLADLKVRQAIEVGIDNDTIAQAAYGNSELFEVNANYMDLKHHNLGQTPEFTFYNKKDPEQAKKLLSESQYNNEEIVLLTTPDYLEMYNATIALQQELNKIGIKAKVDSYDFPTFMEKKGDTKNWDIFITSNGYQVLPQQVLSLTPTWSNATDEQFLGKLDEVKNAKDDAEVKEKYTALVKFMYDEYVPSNVFAHYKSFVVARKNVEGLTYFQQMPFVWNTRVKR